MTVALTPAPWILIVLAVMTRAPSCRAYVPEGTVMVTTVPGACTSAAWIAPRSVHFPALSAHTRPCGCALGASTLELTVNDRIDAAPAGWSVRASAVPAVRAAEQSKENETARR